MDLEQIKLIGGAVTFAIGAIFKAQNFAKKLIKEYHDKEEELRAERNKRYEMQMSNYAKEVEGFTTQILNALEKQEDTENQINEIKLIITEIKVKLDLKEGK